MRRRLTLPFFSLCVLCMLIAATLIPAQSALGQGVSTPTPTPAAQTAGKKRITVDNADQIKEVGRLGKGQANLLDWSPDGKILAVGGSIGVWLYDANAFDSEPRLLDGKTWCSAIAFSPDSTKLATACDGHIIDILDVKSGKELVELRGHTDTITALNFSADGSILASGSDDTSVRLWNTASGQAISVLIPPTPEQVVSVAFSPDATLLASGLKNTSLLIWDLKRKQVVVFRQDGHGVPERLRFAPDGKTVFFGDGDVLASWTMKAAVLPIYHGLEPYYHYGINLAISSDAALVAYVSNDTVVVRDIKTLKKLVTLKASTRPQRYIVFSPDGKQVAAVDDTNIVRVWNVQSSSLVATQTHEGEILDVVFTNSGDQLVSSGYLETTCGRCDIELRSTWDMQSGRLLNVLRGDFKGPDADATFSRDGSFALITVNDQLALQDMQNSKEPVLLKASTWRFQRRVAFSVDRRLVAIDNDGKVVIWDTQTGDPLVAMSTANYGSSLVFSPDGKVLAGDISYGGLVFWDTSTGEQVGGIKQGLAQPYSLTYNADGTLLAVGERDDIDIWDVKANKLTTRLSGQQGRIYGVAFSPDGSLLASVSEDGTIRLWNILTHRLVIQFTGHAKSVYAVAFSPDGTLLVTGGEDGSIRLWGVG